jgi:hypothetical protein
MALVGAANAQPLGTFRPPRNDLDVDHLYIYGERNVSANVKSLASSVELVQTIDGAGTLTITVRDYLRTLLRSNLTQTRSRIVLDNVEFTLAKVSHNENELTMVFEESVVAAMRRTDSPKKANRDNTTRAQFIRGMVVESAQLVGRRIAFNCPEEAIRQPVEPVQVTGGSF